MRKHTWEAVNMETIYYHGTSIERAVSIQKEGFQPQYGRFGEAVYFALTVEEAERFGMAVISVHLTETEIPRFLYREIALRYPGTSIEEEEGLPELREYVRDTLNALAVIIEYDSGEAELCVYEPNIITLIHDVTGEPIQSKESEYLVRDGSGKVFNRVKNPTAVYDARDSVLMKIGEKEIIHGFFEEVQTRYRAFGFTKEANDICMLELPKDQEVIDKVFQICDYIGVLHRAITSGEEKQSNEVSRK
jgi:hypothetical protein